MPCSKCGDKGHNIKTCKGRQRPRQRDNIKPHTFVKEECIICLDTIGIGSTTTMCGHRFCTNCIVKHLRLHNNCPYCRTHLCEPINTMQRLSEQDENEVVYDCLSNNELREYLLKYLKSQIVAGMQKYGVCGIEDILDIIAKEVDLEHSITVVAEDILYLVATHS
jgi:hypothetical protein